MILTTRDLNRLGKFCYNFRTAWNDEFTEFIFLYRKIKCEQPYRVSAF